MMFRRVLALGAVCVFAAGLAPASSFAQSSGYYVGAGLGLALQRDADVSGSGVSASVGTDPGWVGMLSVGHAYGNGFRTEIEASFSRAGVDSVSGASNSDGTVSSLSGMVNALYDFNTNTAFKPYVGLGIGVSRVRYEDVTPIGGTLVSDRDTVLAYQGIAGVSYDLGDNMALTTDYRYFRTADPDFKADGVGTIDSEFGEHRIMVGLRWTFGPSAKPKPKPLMQPVAQPAPQPAPQPKPAPVIEPPKPQVPRTYLVFFDWDRTNLRPDALAIIREAAANSTKTKLTRIVSTGHADRSGTDAYNLALSKRRADAVAAELARLGVPKASIDVVWKGEREPLVPTGDGVREPQNRRVEIVFN
jgi:OOP family OmpA-OmpF porin